MENSISKEMVQTICHALDEKKGENIAVIDIAKISVIADYFVIVSGGSDSQIHALIEAVDEEMHKQGFDVRHQEGTAKSDWVLIDYGDVVVHIFNRDSRSFYNLERIWSDGIRAEQEFLPDQK